jgi:hypothetical protein
VQFTLLLGRPGSPGSNPEGVAALDRGAETHTHTHTRTRILTLTHTHRHATYADPHAAIPRTHTHTHTHTHVGIHTETTHPKASQPGSGTDSNLVRTRVRTSLEETGRNAEANALLSIRSTDSPEHREGTHVWCVPAYARNTHTHTTHNTQHTTHNTHTHNTHTHTRTHAHTHAHTHTHPRARENRREQT